MKVITIKQPHVAAIFARLKRYETRAWQTSYRGELGIHAARTVDLDAQHLDYDSDSLGAIVGVVELVACIPTSDVRTFRDWGDFSRGRFAFELRRPRALATPIPVRGQLGIWNFPGL